MKLSKFISVIIIAVLIFGLGPGVSALELDVEDAMSEFASEVRLLDEELQLLRNPFADQRPREPEPGPAPSPSPDTDAEVRPRRKLKK